MAKEFREHFLGLLALFILSLSIYGFIRLNSDHAAARSKELAAAPTTDIGSADQHLFAAVYTTTGGQTSILGLNNSQNHPITAQVTLYNKHGAALAIPPITIDGHKNHGFDIADWVRNVDGFEEGSLEVFYHDASMAMGAQETITDANHSVSYDVHLQEPMDFMSPRADGLWWALGDSNTNAQVFIANTRETQTTVTPIFYLDGLAHQGDAIILNGHESDSIDIEKALKKLHLSTPAIGGMSLTNTNGPGGLAMVGVISSKRTGFSTTMRFIDQHSQHTTTLHGANILIGKPGPDSGFASTTRFTAHVTVRNNTDQSVQIHPRIRYVLDDQPNSIELAALTLTSNGVRELDLTSVINAIGNNTVTDAGIEMDHSGSPGAVMASAASIDQSGSAVFDVPIKDPASEMGFKGGSYPWNIESDNRAVLHIKNIDSPGDGQKRQAMAKVYFDSGDYNIPLQEMEAGQTVEVDIKKLRDDQVPDVLGHVIPLTVTSGQLDWGPRANRGQFIGRLVQDSPSGAISNSFSCVGACLCDNGFGSAVIYPGLFSGFIGDTFGLQSTETDVDCNQQVVYTYNVGPTQGLQYSSSDSGVVTISGDTGTLVGPGSAEITADWDAFQVTQHCFYSAEGDCVDATCNSRQVDNPIVIGDVAVAPTITAISPSRGVDGAATHVTITGTGFQSGVTINAGSHVTIININVSNANSLTADFTPDISDPGGSRGVTVTVNSQTSNGDKTYYVQIPTHVIPFNDPGAPNGVGPLQTPNNAPLLNIDGSHVADNFCGVGRYYLFSLSDQDNPPQEIVNRPFVLFELFSNYSGAFTIPPDRNGTILQGQEIYDIQSRGFVSAGCLLFGQNETFTQRFDVQFENNFFLLDTQIHLSRGNFNGTLRLDRTIDPP